MRNDQLQELYRKLDGVPAAAADARLAWYGQCRAKEMNHEAALKDTEDKYYSWVFEIYPKRGIELPKHLIEKYPDLYNTVGG